MSDFNEIDLQLLLNSTEVLIAKNKARLKESGEDFNIFSITKIERYENNTHSAMLAELLNPYGTHHQGNCFLFYFLTIIRGLVSDEHPIHRNLKSTPTVFVEFSIGPISEDKLQGGRIDILLVFNDFKLIIENKIDADDQEMQLVRYKNFSSENDIVLYLTKWDKQEASEKTVGDLKAGVDYHCISYQSEILEWLEITLKALTNQYVIDGVKQYYLLVKKITNQLDTKYMGEFNSLISNNLEEAKYIKDNFDAAEQHVREFFRENLLQQLKTKLGENDFISETWGHIDKEESGISLKPRIQNKSREADIYYYISPFTNNEGVLSISICNSVLSESIASELNLEWSKMGKGNALLYPVVQNLKVDLTNLKQKAELGRPEIRKKYLIDMVDQILKFIEKYSDSVEEANNKTI
ncbi:PD-(D/E)XK nuclease family protein [Leeuwenhoekiella sp. LLG6367-2.1]|uniref:PDDEXK-like family protein n=1 Tax=Leeuwenhoekiella sp. LLG6367-2.1 TaxID=3160833 RepID=UPI00386739B2